MTDAPGTPPSLLKRVQDAKDDQAWARFDALYGPLVLDFLRKRGLQAHDASDVAQEVLLASARGLRHFEYDPQRGSFRGWLFTIVQNKLRNFYASEARRVRGSGDSAVRRRLDEQPDPGEDPSALWNRMCEQQVFVWASAQVQPRVAAHNWQAFWRTAVEGENPQIVADQLGLSVAAVRLAKSRVMAQIRKIIEEAGLQE